MNLVAWTLSLTSMTAVIFTNHHFHSRFDSNFSSFAYGLHDGLSRVIWAISMCYIIFACIHDSSGPINWFLSHRFLQPMARLSFAMYIVHRPITSLTMGTIKTPPIISKLTFFAIALLKYILSIFIAILATLAFESPIINLEKVFFGTYFKIESSITNVVQNENAIKLVNAQKSNELTIEKMKTNWLRDDFIDLRWNKRVLLSFSLYFLLSFFSYFRSIPLINYQFNSFTFKWTQFWSVILIDKKWSLTTVLESCEISKKNQ